MKHRRQKIWLGIERIVFVPLILFILVPRAEAQEVFDLSRCVSTGLENNYSLKIARSQEQISENNYTRGNAGFLPSVTTTNRFGGTLNNTVQNLRDGEQTKNNGIHNINGSAGVTLDLTLFRGFSVQTTWQKLGELKQLGELRTQLNMENLASDIIAEYYYYIQQLNLYKNMEYAVELSRERVRIDEQRYLLGASSKLELLQSMVYLNADSSKYARQNEVLRASQIRLKKLMSLPDLDHPVALSDTSILINDSLQYTDLQNATLNYNTELLVAGKNQAVTELDYKIVASRSYPYFNLSSGYSASLNRYETGNLRSQKVHGLNYGLTLGMDIFDGLERKREKLNAMAELESSRYEYQDLEQEISADLLTIFYSYENNLRLLKLEEQNLYVARENLGIAMERYKLGNLSGLELREVQKSLLDAEERLISVKYQTKIAEISLLQISGRIMDYVR